MSEDVWTVLIRLGAEPKSGVHLRVSADNAAIDRMQAAAIRDLGESVPDGYVRLLKITNGVQIDNAAFKEAENLVPENLDIFYPEVIRLGNSGNVDDYVYDKRDRRFHTVTMGFPNERMESYGTFEDMLLGVMKQQGVL